MSRLAELLSDIRFRARSVFRRRTVERELDDELRFHVEREAEKAIRRGASRPEALRQAHIALGGVERIKDDTRDARGVSLLDALAQDVHYTLRGLRSRPGFTAAVVVTLGLGIGANAAMFGVMDRLLFRPPAYLRDANSVSRVYTVSTFRGSPIVSLNTEYLRYLELSGWTSSFSQIAAVHVTQQAIGTGAEVREVNVVPASASLFDFFTARPVLGRFYTAQEDSVPVGAFVTVLSYGFWQEQYGGRADVVGTKLQIGRSVYTIIGVAPQGFADVTVGKAPAMWIPITTYASQQHVVANYYKNYNWGWLEMLVRRKPGVSVEQAAADLTTAYQRSWLHERSIDASVASLESAHPHIVLGPTQIERGPDSAGVGKVVAWITGVAFIVLLIACANVANLLLARAFGRRREIAVRLAMGISRGRLIAQLLTESVILAVLGGVAGIVVARFASRGLGALLGAGDVTATSLIDPRLMAVCAAITLAVGLLTGLAPALHAGRGDVLTSLRAGMREGAYQRSRTRTALVVFQSALSMILLVGAGLFVRSLANVRSLRLGYDVEPVMFVLPNMRGVQMSDDQRRALNQRLMAVAQSVPGVTGVSEAESVPFMNHESTGLYVAGIDSVSKRGRFQRQWVSPDYFKTTGTRLIAGRAITAEDRRDAPKVVVVSEEMAHRLWPGKNAIGQCIRIGADTAPCTTVVGIAENIKERQISHAVEAHYYESAAQAERSAAGLYVRVRGRATEQAEAIRARLQREMPGASYITTYPLAASVGNQERPWQLGATMFLAFGALALTLAAIGLYSVIAYSVAQRTHELGVRIALGARLRDVLKLVLGEGLRVAMAGVAIGGGVAFLASRPLTALLFDESPKDPTVFGLVAVVLLAVAIVASVVPAARAACVDPNLALRAE